MAEIMAAGKKIYGELKNLCVWNKRNAGMGSFYRSKHELVFIWKNGSSAHINNFELGQHGRTRTNVWDYDGITSMRAAGLMSLQCTQQLSRSRSSQMPLRIVLAVAAWCSIRSVAAVRS